ncbi:hypothetical protein GCM10025858_22120 [Alicyclobacillus sacchari]|uniref:molybdopterin-guanine dinucleotide biosynthesis protein B n=1 Tax=Alicyclobacillus sacchari TaxID=392010 RepID=UPI0023EA4406|nr:molybdopterin-guanine dinucleotide biosynthesis protein MobB [Alicyclobacillus sacchari]GMA57709.1 hypothetical protein GCM10025858_22120 [Alicyclobacillus sacchari]
MPNLPPLAFDRARRPQIIGIVGFQDAGKTTAAEALIRAAKRRGLEIGYVKHDGHADQMDWPDWEKQGADTVRAARAGARWTVAASARGWLVHDWQANRVGVEWWLERLLAAAGEETPSIVIIEGVKGSLWPKVAVVASELEWDKLMVAGAVHVVAAIAPTGCRLPVLFAAGDEDGLLDFLLADGLEKGS